MIDDRIWTPALGRSLIPQSCANTRTKTRYLKSNDQNKIYRFERTSIYMILIDFLQMYAIESIKTTSMENVNTGVLDKNKEPYLRSNDKAEKSNDVLRQIQLHMSKCKRNGDLQSIMSNLQPNCCLKVDFQNHDTKRHKGNQLQNLKLPCKISKLRS